MKLKPGSTVKPTGNRKNPIVLRTHLRHAPSRNLTLHHHNSPSKATSLLKHPKEQGACDRVRDVANYASVLAINLRKQPPYLNGKSIGLNNAHPTTENPRLLLKKRNGPRINLNGNDFRSIRFGKVRG